MRENRIARMGRVCKGLFLCAPKGVGGGAGTTGTAALAPFPKRCLPACASTPKEDWCPHATAKGWPSCQGACQGCQGGGGVGGVGGAGVWGAAGTYRTTRTDRTTGTAALAPFSEMLSDCVRQHANNLPTICAICGFCARFPIGQKKGPGVPGRFGVVGRGA